MHELLVLLRAPPLLDGEPRLCRRRDLRICLQDLSRPSVELRLFTPRRVKRRDAPSAATTRAKLCQQRRVEGVADRELRRLLVVEHILLDLLQDSSEEAPRRPPESAGGVQTSSSDHLSRSSTPVSCSRGTPSDAALSRKRYSSPHQSEATLPVRSRFSRFLIRILPRRPLTATSCCTGGGGDRRGALALSPIAIPTATLPATAVGISTATLPSPPSLTPLARPSASSPPSPSHDRSHESTSASCARCSCTSRPKKLTSLCRTEPSSTASAATFWMGAHSLSVVDRVACSSRGRVRHTSRP